MPSAATVRRVTADRTAPPTAPDPAPTSDRSRRALELLALAVSLLDLVFTLRALRRRSRARPTLYRDARLPDRRDRHRSATSGR